MASEEVYSSLVQLIGNDNVNSFVSLTGLPTNSAVLILAVSLIIISIWTLIWKGLALWKSAHNNHKIWFVVFILPINTAGILEILYIYLFSKMHLNKKSNFKKNKKKS